MRNLVRSRTLRGLVLAGVVGLAVGVPTAFAGGAPSIAFNPTSNDYGTIDTGTTASKTFTLRNSGGVATSALVVSISGTGAAAFSRTADTCSATSLGPKKSCSITVQFAPTTAGSTYSATLTARGKKPAAIATATLSGATTNPNADISLSYSPGYTGAGDPPEVFPPTVAIANAGPASATVSLFVSGVSGIGGSSLVDVTGDAISGFTVTTLNPLAAGHSVSFYVTGLVKIGAYAEVTASSEPDPDSTPNNGVTTEDDYASIPGTVTQANYDCAGYGGTYSTDSASDFFTPEGIFQWSCNGFTDQNMAALNALDEDCSRTVNPDLFAHDTSHVTCSRYVA